MASKETSITITNLSGGRNGYDTPLNIPDDQCQEARNVDFWQSPMGTKRWGAAPIGVTFSSGGPFGGPIGSLHRFVPAADETAAELWAVDRTVVNRFARLAGGTTWVEASLVQNLNAASDADNVVSAGLNGFLYFCYKSAATDNRSYVWDPLLSKVRKTGIATPIAPTGSNGAAGGLSFTRYYRVRNIDLSGSDIRRRSEASPVLSFTIASKAGVDVTRVTTGEDATHWELEASDAATGPWYRIATTAIGTTTYSNNSATIPTSDANGSTLSAVDGINRPPPAAQYIIATDSRLILAGRQSNVATEAYVKSRTQGIYITPVIGDNDVGDSERIPVGLTYTVDAPITGLGGPLDGAFYVFSYRRIWKFVPTSNPADPYARYSISTSVGCIRHQSIVSAEDENGNPCIYFLSAKGPYRVGSNGVQYLGADVSDLWATVNLAGPCHAVYHGDKHQVWFFVPTVASSVYTDFKLKFDARNGRPESDNQVRKGWSWDSGESTHAYASVMFSATIGASMSRDLKPLIAYSTAPGQIWRCDVDGVTTDAGTSYTGIIYTKEYAPAGLLYNISVGQPSIVYTSPRASSNEQFKVGLYGDFGHNGATQATPLIVTKTVAWATGATDFAPYHSKVEGLELAGIGSFMLRLGDFDAATTQMFAFYGLEIPFEAQERR